MNLGILCTMINGFGRRGYYNSQEVGLGKALAGKGHRVVIYKGVDAHEQADRVITPEGVRIRYLPMRRLGANGWMDTRLLSEKLDALFVFGDQQLFLPHVWHWCRRRGIVFVPYIGTAHSVYVGSRRAQLTNWLYNHGTRRIYLQTPVLVKTPAARTELTAQGVPDSAITWAPVGIDASVLRHDFRRFDRDELRAEYGLEPDDVVICNVSRLTPEKRPLDLIDILLRVRGKKKFRMIIVGEGELDGPLRRKIRDHHLEGEVLLLPRVPYDEMWKIYHLSDYYLNLNRGEIFGMAIMEAVCYETSVAAISALGPSITLKGMRGHKLCETDEELADWLTAPYPSREELHESSEKMIRTFTWDRTADAFLRLIRESHSR